jgi:Mg2+ and Co2+ transporter CorA
MAKPSIVPMLKAVLEPFLEEIQQEWHAGGRSTPTLPVTDGKVNVRQVVRLLAKRDERVVQHHEQHLYRKAELRTAVNAVADEQGLEPIGSRSPEEAHDAARQRIGKLSGEASELRQAMAEREAVIDDLRRENASLRAQMAMLEETGMVVRLGTAR